MSAGAPMTAIALSGTGDYRAAGAGEQAFIFRTAEVPVPATATPAENATPEVIPTQAGGAGAIIGIIAVAAGAARGLSRRRQTTWERGISPPPAGLSRTRTEQHPGDSGGVAGIVRSETYGAGREKKAGRAAR